MTHPLLWMLYVCAVFIQLTIDVSKFIIIHSIVCAILLKDAVKSIDWNEVNVTRNRIGGYFVYA